MLERDRLESKKISKTQAVTSQLGHPMPASNVHIGPSDYVPWMTDRKWCYIRMEGTTFGDVPLNCELKLEVWDSPNSAGVVIDAIRCAKLALDRGVSGALVGPSSYFMKTPPQQFTDEKARRLTEAFIAGDDVSSAVNGNGAVVTGSGGPGIETQTTGRPASPTRATNGDIVRRNGRGRKHAKAK